MSPPATPRYDPGWTRGNLAALTVLCLAAAIALGLRYADRPVRVGRRPAVFQERAKAASEKINPNLADSASLLRLPTIGPARAKAIIDYRKAHGSRAFRTAADLKAIKGIGPATVRKIDDYLSLPARTDPPGPTSRRGQ
ncbi:MAG: ComEA family DNA-binding protein [Phycisphaerae bacterium]